MMTLHRIVCSGCGKVRNETDLRSLIELEGWETDQADRWACSRSCVEAIVRADQSIGSTKQWYRPKERDGERGEQRRTRRLERIQAGTYNPHCGPPRRAG